MDQAHPQCLPTTLPKEEIRYLIDILTGKKAVDTYEAVKAAFLVSGYLLHLLFGKGTPAPLEGVAIPQTVGEVQGQLVEALQALEGSNDAVVPALSLDPQIVLRLLVQLIMEWLKL